MNPIDEMRELIDKLNYYTKLYDEGKPEIPDKEWDNLYFKLQELEKETGIILANSPTNHIDYQVVNNLTKVTHNHSMLSLDKTKSEEDVINFLGKYNGIAMAKMDGLTCSIRYLDGKLVSGETRGNGTIGEDITHNIKFVKGVPLEIPIKEEFIVDGEVICTYEDFKDFEGDYKNPRNFASGSIRLLDSRASAKRKLTFVAWDCIAGLDCETLSEKLIELDILGFITVPFIKIMLNSDEYKINKTLDYLVTHNINSAINYIKEITRDKGYPIDGVVFKYDDCAYYSSLGETAHHARGGLAFKFYDEEYETYLKDIEWQVGKTGQITPIAVYDDIDTGDSIVNRASLHNLNIMRQLLGDYPFKGEKIWVCKQNEIIPQVVRAEGLRENFINGNNSLDKTYSIIEDKLLIPPAKCPICGGETYIQDDFLYCGNPNCEGKFLNLLKHFAGKKGLDIKGLSEATLQKLMDWGWIGNYQEVFSLSNFRNEWIAKDGFGPKSVDKILEAIETSRNCELFQFISSLSIPHIGLTYAKEIAKREETWESFILDIEEGFNFMSWPNFGPEMYDSITSFDYSEANALAREILTIKNSLWVDPNAVPAVSDSAIKGKSFVITGKLTTVKNRDEFTKLIEANGGKVLGSVSKNTSYLVNNDINSTSSKNAKAKQLGIPIITEQELLNMIK